VLTALHPLVWRSLSIALLTSVLAALVYLMTDLDSGIGLDFLFRLRGERQAPNEVVIIAMDEASEQSLGVSRSDLSQWRRFHVDLLHELQRQNAALVIFDLQFIRPLAEVDPQLADAMRQGKNVLLTECVQKLRHGVEDFYGSEECSDTNKQVFAILEQTAGKPDTGNALPEGLVVTRRVVANDVLTKSALDHAPYPLERNAGSPTVRNAWTFLDEFAEIPTLPVLAALYWLQASHEVATDKPADAPLSAWLVGQRRQCRQNSAFQFSQLLTQWQAPKSELADRLTALICEGSSRNLDFYGPPGKLRMESYADVKAGKVQNLNGKAVFVGKANRKYSGGPIDYFPTPFTAGPMAGLEIMATQFANLHEYLLAGRHLHAPLPPTLVLFLFGAVAAGLQVRLAGYRGILAGLSFGGLYAGFSCWVFQHYAWWLPTATPVLLQLPLTWVLASLWARKDLLAEMNEIMNFVEQVFPSWAKIMPGRSGQASSRIDKIKAQLKVQRDVYGICLATDIQGYTTIAEKQTPLQTWDLMKEYYSVLGKPVRANQGEIANIVADSMMAFWLNASRKRRRYAACIAALEIQEEVERFNRLSKVERMTTRIGLHEGELMLGGGEAADFKIFAPFGDTLNATSRIEGANKDLNTLILASANIVINNPIIHRPVGCFRLRGREEPLALVEIIGKDSEVSETMLAKISEFAEGLEAFQQGRWQAATACFKALLKRYVSDGPSEFYLQKAEAFLAEPETPWLGFIELD